MFVLKYILLFPEKIQILEKDNSCFFKNSKEALDWAENWAPTSGVNETPEVLQHNTKRKHRKEIAPPPLSPLADAQAEGKAPVIILQELLKLLLTTWGSC